MHKNVILLPCVVFAETLGTVKFDSHATDCPRPHEIAFCSLVDTALKACFNGHRKHCVWNWHGTG